MSTAITPDRLLAREGARLRWRLEGSGPAIVLLHGWALDLDYWNLVVPVLARHFSVLRFDRAGFGLSQGEPDLHRNVPDLHALLREAGVARAVLVGMSQGARLAMHFSLAHPGQVRGLVLDGAPAFDAEPELPMAEFRRLLQEAGAQALRAAIRSHPVMQLLGTGADARAQLDVLLARYTGADLLQARGSVPPPQVAEIRAPVLLLNGIGDSTSRHMAADRLAAALPRATRRTLAKAGHLAALDDPEGYAREVIAFTAGLPREAS